MIKMGHVLEASVAHHYQKIWEVTPPPPPTYPNGANAKTSLCYTTHPPPPRRRSSSKFGVCVTVIVSVS